MKYTNTTTTFSLYQAAYFYFNPAKAGLLMENRLRLTEQVFCPSWVPADQLTASKHWRNGLRLG